MGLEIIAGVDGSAESLAAADWAAREAGRRGLPLRLVHAWLWQPLDLPLVQEEGDQQRLAEHVAEEAATAVAAAHPDVALSAEVVPDTPVPGLLGLQERAAMVVIGSRGHGPVAGFLLGSYGQQIIAGAERPVVAVRPGRGGEGAGADDDSGEVVVGQLGGADDSASALRFAFETAAARGAVLRAVRAWSLPPLYAYSPGSMRLADEAGGLVPFEEKALHEVLAPWRERYPDVRVAEHVEIGSAGEVLLSASASASLLVVGRRAKRGAVGPRIGSVAHAALHHANCPVAVVPHD